MRRLLYQPMNGEKVEALPGLIPLWFGMLAGPAAWVAHVSGGYFLGAMRCDQGFDYQPPLYHALTALTIVATLAGGAVAYWAWRKAGGGLETRGEPPIARARFMALTGLIVAASSLALIVFGYIPTITVDICARSH